MKNLVDEASTLYQTGANMLASCLPLLKTDTSPSWLIFRATPSVDPSKAARVRALGGSTRSSRLEDAADSPNNSVLINDDRAVERRSIARELRREIAHGVVPQAETNS